MTKTIKRKQRRNKSHKKRQQHGGARELITIDEIKASIMRDDFEICGYIDKTDRNKQYKEGQGEPKREGSRGSCSSPDHTIIWHTHSHVSKYYPSLEDIKKVLKSTLVKESIIYTVYGFWVLSFDGKITFFGEDFDSDVSNILDTFYFKTGRGREYNKAEIDKLISVLTNYIEKELGCGFTIRWQDW